MSTILHTKQALANRECPCGTTFAPRDRVNRYCSTDCKLTIRGTCQDCGDQFAKSRTANASEASKARCVPCARSAGAAKRIKALTDRGLYGKAKPEAFQPAEKRCNYCAENYIAKHPTMQYCTPRCGYMWTSRGGAIRRPCRDCGIDLGLWGKARTCENCQLTRTRRARSHRDSDLKRAQNHGVDYEYINRTKVFNRDDWRCGICFDAVDRDTSYPHPRSASLDHIIPVSKGGPHRYENVQLAHLECNLAKADSLP